MSETNTSCFKKQYGKNRFTPLLTLDERFERLRPKCDLMETKYQEDTYPGDLGDCGSSKRATCPKCAKRNLRNYECEDCGHMKDEIDECACKTYYCRNCSRYVENPEKLPTCIGYPLMDPRHTYLIGWKNQEIIEELGLDFEKLLKETNHRGW